MPRGKELEQMPMANILPKAPGKFDHEILSGITTDVTPIPAKVKENQQGKK